MPNHYPTNQTHDNVSGLSIYYLFLLLRFSDIQIDRNAVAFVDYVADRI